MQQQQLDVITRLQRENEELLRKLQVKDANANETLNFEVKKLRQQMESMERTRQSFLSADQIKMLEQGRMSQ